MEFGCDVLNLGGFAIAFAISRNSAFYVEKCP
jgi:hypothetical protein